MYEILKRIKGQVIISCLKAHRNIFVYYFERQFQFCWVLLLHWSIFTLLLHIRFSLLVLASVLYKRLHTYNSCIYFQRLFTPSIVNQIPLSTLFLKYAPFIVPLFLLLAWILLWNNIINVRVVQRSLIFRFDKEG